MGSTRKRPVRAETPAARDAAIASAIERWFASHARDLPWRRETTTADGEPRRDPYHSLVSELMLQQTQVSRVIDRFETFIARFPTVRDLARATEDDVLALWSGLGYYRRARLLHAAARFVVAELNGEFPADALELRRLPGVGRYTAGAIASMALGQRTPLVDGNVMRVLLRVDARPGRTGDKQDEAWAWDRATSLVEHAATPGRLNEGLMELGATVCMPAAPLCGVCPLASVCRAKAEGKVSAIPAPKEANARRALYCASVLIRDDRGRIAVQRRSATGMWGGLWEAPTLERSDAPATTADLREWLQVDAAAAIHWEERFLHRTTHRDVTFDVWRVQASDKRKKSWDWVTPDTLDELGMSNPQRRILEGALRAEASLFGGATVNSGTSPPTLPATRAPTRPTRPPQPARSPRAQPSPEPAPRGTPGGKAAGKPKRRSPLPNTTPIQ